MPDLLPDLLSRLQEPRFTTLSLPKDLITPEYAGGSILNLPASICAWLGAPPLGAEPLADAVRADFSQTYRRVILLVVDGLGLNRFLTLADANPAAYPGLALWRRLLPDCTLAPLTSIVPSTTAAALTTLWTGQSPAAHGIVGYELWLREYGVVANMIKHNVASFNDEPGSLRRGGFQLDSALNLPVMGAHLAVHGIQTHAFQHISIARSGLSTMLLQGANGIPYVTQSDLWVTLSALIKSRPDNRQYIYIYWSDLDELGHRFGPNDERITREFDTFSLQLARFLHDLKQTAKGETLFLMTADHGQIFTPRVQTYELKHHPQFIGWLTVPPTGEKRFGYLYLHPRSESRLHEYVENTWHGKYRLFSAEQVRNAGLLGPGVPAATLKERMGDWVMLALEDAYWWWGDKENTMLGRHGGLSPEEMLVPLLILAS